MTRGITFAAVMLAAVMPHAAAQQSAYPDKTIRPVVPFSPGDALDIVARILGQGIEPMASTPDEFARGISQNIAQFA